MKPGRPIDSLDDPITALRSIPTPPADFVSRLVHELRGQLGVAIGALNELDLRSDGKGEERLVAMARRGVLRALRTSDRFSRVTQLESQVPFSGAAPTSLSALLMRCYQEALLLEPGREIALHFTPDDSSCPELSVDWVHAALVELIWVALKHTKASIHMAVIAPCTIEIRTDAGAFHLEPLREAESLTQRSGTSLALSFADAVARRHGGELRTDANDTGGVRCSIRFGSGP